jgi:hypothetical protein
MLVSIILKIVSQTPLSIDFLTTEGTQGNQPVAGRERVLCCYSLSHPRLFLLTMTLEGSLVPLHGLALEWQFCSPK